MEALNQSSRLLRRQFPRHSTLYRRRIAASRSHATAPATNARHHEHDDLPLSSPAPTFPHTSFQPHPLPASSSPRKTPVSPNLTDTFARKHTYLRISLTQRCNLRCQYCMPLEGVPLLPKDEILTTDEILALSEMFVAEGVNKIRLTGGEPSVRRDFLDVVKGLGALKSRTSSHHPPFREDGTTNTLSELCITSNGLTLERKLESLVTNGLTGLNLSLDTLSPGLFQILTRRNGHEKVLSTLHCALAMKKAGAQLSLKINVVVMRNINDHEILDFCALAASEDISVRFIEYMPFDGNRWEKQKMVSYGELVRKIKDAYPSFGRRIVNGAFNETSKEYTAEGWRGSVGFISSMTDNFCSGCNRLRVTAEGNLKVCLFGQDEVSLRDILRESSGGQPLTTPFAELDQQVQMSTREKVMAVVGGAVSKKKARHAGMDTLKVSENRPMILIDDAPLIAPHRPRPSLTHHFLPAVLQRTQIRLSSSTSGAKPKAKPPTSLPHLTSTSEAHITSISSKAITFRSATAIGTIRFSLPSTYALVKSAALKKGDVLSVSRVAGLLAAKNTSQIVPLCHSGVPIEGARMFVEVVPPFESTTSAAQDPEIGKNSDTNSNTEDKETDDEDKELHAFLTCPDAHLPHGGLRLAAVITTTAKTGIEMEALVGVSGAGLSALDMLKGVDRGVVMGEVKVVRKAGGRSGEWKASFT